MRKRGRISLIMTEATLTSLRMSSSPSRQRNMKTTTTPEGLQATVKFAGDDHTAGTALWHDCFTVFFRPAITVAEIGVQYSSPKINGSRYVAVRFLPAVHGVGALLWRFMLAIATFRVGAIANKSLAELEQHLRQLTG